MDGLDLIKAFREVALRRNFTRAATSLGMSKATVSRYVSEFEEHCGVRLINRSTRSLSLTQAGELLLECSSQLVEIAESTLQDLHGHASQPRGRLRISAPHGLITGWFSDMLAKFLKIYPEIYVSLILSNDEVDLVSEGIDIRLAGGPIEDMNLIVRRLARFSLVLCASPNYWAERGLPNFPEELKEHDILSCSSLPTARFPFESNGRQYDVEVRSRMEANDPLALIELAARSIGVVCVPEILARSYIERGVLVPVLKEHMRTDHWVYAAYTQRRHNSAAMRAMLDFIVQSMAEK